MIRCPLLAACLGLLIFASSCQKTDDTAAPLLRDGLDRACIASGACRRLAGLSQRRAVAWRSRFHRAASHARAVVV